MPDAVLDTSVVVRFLTRDDLEKAEAARVRIETAEEGALLMPDVAVAEVAFVLLRVYRWPVGHVAEAIRGVVTQRGIQVPGRELWLDVAEDVEQGRGPVDAYLMRTAERAGIGEVLTFDEGIRPLAGIRCATP